MSDEKLRSYSINVLKSLLGIDEDSCNEIIDYSLQLPTDHDQQMHFLNLLGESDDSFEFVRNFMLLRKEAVKQKEKENKKLQQKKTSRLVNKEPVPSGPTKMAWREPEKEQKVIKGRLEGNTVARTTSELLNMKPKSAAKAKKAKVTEKKKLNDLSEIESAITELELEGTDNLENSSQVKRVCNCMGRRHPLFKVAPNCLNCGKIICAKEGLQPCSFCGKELLSSEEKFKIIDILRNEKSQLDGLKPMQVKEAPVTDHPKQKPKKVVVKMNAGENLWKAQRNALKKVEEEKRRAREDLKKLEEEKKEIREQEAELAHYEKTSDLDPELREAQERLDRLLEFQATGAERTRIIDNASDFEMPTNKHMMWLSTAEKALMLKKQQKQLKKIEDEEKVRTGRSKKSLQMVIKDGKVTMVETSVPITRKDEDGEIKEIQEKMDEDKRTESENSNGIWDFEKDANKWERPKYIQTSEKYVEHEKPNNKRFEFQSRVQMPDISDENELITAI